MMLTPQPPNHAPRTRRRKLTGLRTIEDVPQPTRPVFGRRSVATAKQLRRRWEHTRTVEKAAATAATAAATASAVAAAGALAAPPMFPRLQWLGCAAGVGSAAHALQLMLVREQQQRREQRGEPLLSGTLSCDTVRVERLGTVFRCAESLLSCEGDWGALPAEARQDWRRLGWAGGVRRTALQPPSSSSATAADSADEVASIVVDAIVAAQHGTARASADCDGGAPGSLLLRCYSAAPDAVTAELRALLRLNPDLAAKLVDGGAALVSS